MSRFKGSHISTVYDTNKRFPLDARMLVGSYADLINPQTWIPSGQSSGSNLFNGMLTVVTEDGYKGLYCLINKDAVTDENYLNYVQDKSIGNPVNQYFSMWEKYASDSDLTTLLQEIQADYATIDFVEERVKSVEGDRSVATYAYRSLFPAKGDVNKLYVAVDTETSYIWHNNEYLPVGGGSEQPDIIFGGTAD